MVCDINKHLRSISLTLAISKIAEEFLVERYVAPAILEVIDRCSSATHALISMIHTWSKSTDGTGSSVRVVLFDYQKAFDLIDHQILANKILQLSMPLYVKRWVIDFLMFRQQRVKLLDDCFSDWSDVRSGVPQGTKLGPWLFILMINNLDPQSVDRWKFVDDTTISETVSKNSASNIQTAVDYVQNWSSDNRLKLNELKCKELVIDFSRAVNTFQRIIVNGNELELVSHAKILGLVISDDLKWNDHVYHIIKKVNKHIYSVVQLKRAKVATCDIVQFYSICIRPILEYSCQVFHHGLPKYLSLSIDCVLSIIQGV